MYTVYLWFWPTLNMQDAESEAQVQGARVAATVNLYLNTCSSLLLSSNYFNAQDAVSEAQVQGARVAATVVLYLNAYSSLLLSSNSFNAQDAESEAQVQGALDAAMAARDRTVIVIAHRLSTVRNADVTVVMDKGTVSVCVCCVAVRNADVTVVMDKGTVSVCVCVLRRCPKCGRHCSHG